MVEARKKFGCGSSSAPRQALGTTPLLAGQGTIRVRVRKVAGVGRLPALAKFRKRTGKLQNLHLTPAWAGKVRGSEGGFQCGNFEAVNCFVGKGFGGGLMG